MDMTRCSLGKFLVAPTFVTRRLHICKAARDPSCSLGKFLVIPTFVTGRLYICRAARDPSGRRWNYLSRRLSCNFA